MKQGELLGDFLISTKPTNAGGGKCVWAFATKDGEEFFIKQFLDPKWPLDSSPGSAESKRRRRADCAVFEERHRRIMELLKSDSVGGGNIVTAEAFFRDRATYYKVTKRIDASNVESLKALTAHQKAVVLRTLGLSLQQLHRIGIVHGDLKPDNVLVQKRPGNDLYTAKLIDFDDSYLAGQPPESATVGGDSQYGAPEWLGYIQGESHSDGAELTTAVDMFALGLMLHEYLTGELPGFPERFSSPGEAVKGGTQLVPAGHLHPDTSHLVMALTDSRPQLRPTIEAFLDAIDDESKLDPSVARTAPSRPAAPADRGSRLFINMGPGSTTASSGESGDDHGSVPPPRRRDEHADRPARPSRLRIHFDAAEPGRHPDVPRRPPAT